MAEATAKVMQTLFLMATSGKNTAATIFCAKMRCGLREQVFEPNRVAEPPTIIVQIDKPEEPKK